MQTAGYQFHGFRARYSGRARKLIVATGNSTYTIHRVALPFYRCVGVRVPLVVRKTSAHSCTQTAPDARTAIEQPCPAHKRELFPPRPEGWE